MKTLATLITLLPVLMRSVLFLQTCLKSTAHNVNDKHAPTTMNHKLQTMNKITPRDHKLKSQKTDRVAKQKREKYFFTVILSSIISRCSGNKSALLSRLFISSCYGIHSGIITGSPSSKYEHRRASAIKRQLRPPGFSLKKWVGRPTHFLRLIKRL